MVRKSRSKNTNIELAEHDHLLISQIKKLKTQTTCFFNNKGGVGRTTLVANLGAELSINSSAKVLIVGADPQYNLTQYVLSDEEIQDLYGQENPDSIYTVIGPLSFGKGYEGDLPIRHVENSGFDIIVGDSRLALQEDLLAGDWRDAKGGGMRGIRTTFVFAELIKKARELNYDFIFFDMGPSLGAINRAVLLTMEFFAISMSIDAFSLWATKNIGSTVSIWKKELDTGVRLSEEPSELSQLSLQGKLKFLGYVIQQHKERFGYDTVQLKNTEEGIKSKRQAKAYKDIGEVLPSKITEHLSKLYASKDTNPHLRDIRHLSSPAPKSQSQHVPMISVSGTGNYTKPRKSTRELYRDIARRYSKNIQTANDEKQFMAIYNEDLINDLTQRKIVLFLGAGMSSSINLDADNRFKGWPTLLEDASNDREPSLKKQIKELLSSKDYPIACELLQADYGESWERKITKEYGHTAQPSSLHRALISLGQRIILTTNSDKPIESAWTSSLADGDRRFKVISKVDNDVSKVLKEHGTSYIIEIHGSIDDVSNIMFSRSQYIKLTFGNENYSLFLDSLLLNYTSLFIDLSMDDPAITSLMELYAYRYPRSRPRYIITNNNIPQNIREIRRRLRKSIVVPYNVRNNYTELPELIEEMVEKVEIKMRTNIASMLAKAIASENT